MNFYDLKIMLIMILSNYTLRYKTNKKDISSSNNAIHIFSTQLTVPMYNLRKCDKCVICIGYLAGI